MQSVNLLPPELRRRRLLIGRAKVWGAVFAALSVVFVAAERSLAWRLRALRTAVARDDGRVLQLAAAKVQARRLIERQERFREKRAALHRLAERSDWEDVIREVAAVVGDAVWLRELHINDTVRPGTKPRISDVVDADVRPGAILKLSGMALSNAEFARFMARLSESRLLGDVKPAEARVGRLLGRKLVEFSVVCALSSGSE